jgi:hypothetical protein
VEGKAGFTGELLRLLDCAGRHVEAWQVLETELKMQAAIRRAEAAPDRQGPLERRAAEQLGVHVLHPVTAGRRPDPVVDVPLEKGVVP